MGAAESGMILFGILCLTCLVFLGYTWFHNKPSMKGLIAFCCTQWCCMMIAMGGMIFLSAQAPSAAPFVVVCIVVICNVMNIFGLNLKFINFVDGIVD